MRKLICFLLVFCVLAGAFSCMALEVDTINNLLSSKYMILVNREYTVSSDYVPSDLVTYPGSSYKLEKNCAAALQKLINACAAANGERLVLYSGYRTYQTQYNKYYNKVNQYINNGYSRDKAITLTDQYYARPGASEHHTGLAADICTPSSVNKYGQLHESFGNTAEGKWLKKNSWKYGFILRYEKGKEHITGYNYEPWHFRYVGDIAEEIYQSGLTYEEYFAKLKTAQNKLSSAPEMTIKNNKVFLSAPDGVTIRYTSDGSTPTMSSKAYSSAFSTKNKTYKAIAFYDGHTSAVATVTITKYGDIFKDISTKDWYYSAVSKAVNIGAFSGTGDYTFAPNTEMSRAMIAQVLANINGVDLAAYKGKTAYRDVSSKKWYAAAINWATEQNIVQGIGNSEFAPNTSITREQVCTVLYNATTTKKYTLKNNTFTDQESISSWAKKGVAFCYQNDIVNGYPEGTFQPQH